MSTAPAYWYYPERIPERAPRPHIDVVPGRGTSTQTTVLPSSVIFLAKAVAVVLVAICLVSFVRIGFAAATVTTSMASQELSNQIDDARSSGATLEVSQSLLSNPTRLKQAASEISMAAPAAAVTIKLEQDVVATDAEGNLSLSKSVSNATGAGA